MDTAIIENFCLSINYNDFTKNKSKSHKKVIFLKNRNAYKMKKKSLPVFLFRQKG